MKPYFSWLVIGAFLVVIPLGSWYYLQQGLDYRKNALALLQTKHTLPILPDSLDVFSGKTSLVVLDTNAAVLNAVSLIQDQFKDAYTFQIVGNINQTYTIQIPKEVADLFHIGQGQFAIVDTASQVRRYYTDEMAQLKEMVEHLAIVLPKAKDKDIKMK
ncbi:MAG: hypothetical protein WAT79_05075 [Saprospiraceae bacterium]